MTAPTRNRLLTETDRSIFRIAIPALAALAIDPLLTLTDTFFVARLGTNELAALGVNAAILSFAFLAFNFLAFVTTPLVARALGSGRSDEARQYVGTALALAVTIGVLVVIALQLLAPTVIGLMGAEGEVAEHALTYLRIRGLAAVFVLVVITGHGAFRGHKDTRTPLKVAVVVNLVNLALDPLFIFTFGWGMAGAAWAAVVAQGIGAAMFIWMIRNRDMARRPRSFAESAPALLTLGRNGALLTIRSIFLTATFALAASTATRLGPHQIAAHQLVFQGFILAVMIADALEIAAQALVAEKTAGRDLVAVRALTRRLLFWGSLVGLFLAAFIGFGRHALALLASEPAVGDLVVSAAGVGAVAIVIGSVLFVSDGVFSGLLAFGTMALSTGAGFLVAVSLMMWSPLGDSLRGVWWAIGVFFLVRGLVFLVRYRSSAETAVRS